MGNSYTTQAESALLRISAR